MSSVYSRLAGIAACVCVLLAISAPARAFEIEPVSGETGIEAWLVSEDTVPIVALEALFHAGSHLDPQDKPGLADMTVNLLTEGAGDLDSQAFAARLRDLNVSLSISAGRDTIQVRMRTLTENVDEAFELVRLALSEPRFEATDIERVRAQSLASLASDEEDPDTVAYRTFFSEVFSGHPYANSPSGTPESVAAITVEDMRGYAAQAFARDNLSLAVVGDISAEDLAPLIDKAFGGLPETTDTPDTAATARLVPGVTVIQRDNPQSVVIFGMDGMLRSDEDFIPAYVMNYVLGGGSFVSRMFREVREERGLVYTAYTSLYPLRHGGVLMGYLASANASAGEALKVAREQIADVAQNGITAEELDAAKTYLTGSYALRFDSSRAIAGQLAVIQFEGLGLDYVETRNSLVDAVTPEDISRVAKRLLKPDALRIVAVGAPEGITATMEAPASGAAEADTTPQPDPTPAPAPPRDEPTAPVAAE